MENAMINFCSEAQKAERNFSENEPINQKENFIQKIALYLIIIQKSPNISDWYQSDVLLVQLYQMKYEMGTAVEV